MMTRAGLSAIWSSTFPTSCELARAGWAVRLGWAAVVSLAASAESLNAVAKPDPPGLWNANMDADQRTRGISWSGGDGSYVYTVGGQFFPARPPFALERLLVRRGEDGRISRVCYVLPRHKAASWVGPGRGQKSTPPGANGVVELSPVEFLDRLIDVLVGRVGAAYTSIVGRGWRGNAVEI